MFSKEFVLSHFAGEIIDRHEIALLKFSKFPNSEDARKVFLLYKNIMRKLGLMNNPLREELYNTHKEIWSLEYDIRMGKEGSLGLEEVGRRAIAIRKLNAKRIAIKNEIDAEYGYMKEVKFEHASEVES
jgi:hypothetical protein